MGRRRHYKEMRNWRREAQNIVFLPHFHILNADSFCCVSTEIADNWFGCQNINHSNVSPIIVNNWRTKGMVWLVESLLS